MSSGVGELGGIKKLGNAIFKVARPYERYKGLVLAARLHGFSGEGAGEQGGDKKLGIAN